MKNAHFAKKLDNMNNNNLIVRLIIVLLIYLAIKYFVPNGGMILYPINLLVTFLHEFGHALGAVITGGDVVSLHINENGSGLCTTIGGNRPIILMGGYIGSAILGNILFYIGTKTPRFARIAMTVLAIAMAFSGLFWYGQMFTTGLLLAFSIIAILFAWKTDFSGNILMFLGLASIIHIIEDFNVGPTSDLEQYAKIFVLVPASVWMYVWLIIVVILFIFNMKWILKGSLNENNFRT